MTSRRHVRQPQPVSSRSPDRDTFLSWPQNVGNAVAVAVLCLAPTAVAAATVGTVLHGGIAAPAAVAEDLGVAAPRREAHVLVRELEARRGVGGIELAPIAGSPGKRAFDAFLACWERGVLIRTTGDIIAMSPPLIISKAEIDRLIGTLKEVLDTLE